MYSLIPNSMNTEKEDQRKIEDLLEKEIRENLSNDDQEKTTLDSGTDEEEEDKLAFGFSFNAQDGESGDESEDNGDLPSLMQKPGHRYDPNIESAHPEKLNQDSIVGGMHIANEDEIGFAYGEDTYVDPED